MVILGSAGGMEDSLVEEVEARRAVFNLFYQLPRAALMKDQKLDDLEQSNFIVSQFGRVEVQSQSVSRAVLFLTAPGREIPDLLFLVSGFANNIWLMDVSLQSHGHLLPMCVHILFPLWIVVPLSKFPLVLGSSVKLE